MEVNKYWKRNSSLKWQYKVIELEVCIIVYYLGVEVLYVLKMEVSWDCSIFFILMQNILNEFILEKK